MWTCRSCAEQNPDGTPSCEVCATRVFVAEPQPRGPAARSAPMPFPGPRRLLLLAVLAVISVVVTVAVLLPQLRQSDDPEVRATIDAELGAPAAATEPPTDPPTEDATAVGIVTVDPSVVDYRASEVAAMFDTYFSGINNKDYDAVGTVLERNDAQAMAGLEDGTRSTQDSEVTLLTLDDAGDGLLTAEVVFQSNQDPGAGPADREQETCTRWDIVYTLSTPYRIRSNTALSEPC